MFPDDEELIQAEFERTLDFDLGLARSAADPDDPDSPVGIDVEPFYLDPDDIDPQNGQTSLFDFKFSESPTAIRRRCGCSPSAASATSRCTTGSTAARSRPRRPASGRAASDYGVGNGTYYHVVSGEVTGTDPGDSVEGVVRGRRRERATRSPTTSSPTAASGVLILAAEDYTGASPVQPPGRPADYLSFYEDALSANGVEFDVYDVDAHGRTAPDTLGVLSHYDAVVWYTGDDVVTREPGWGPGNASRLAMQELLRGARLRQRGRARALHRPARPASSTRPASARSSTTRSRTSSAAPTRPCEARLPGRFRVRRLAGRPDRVHRSARRSRRPDGGSDPETGEPFDVAGIDDPLDGLTLGFNGADSAQNQVDELARSSRPATSSR